LLRRIGADQEFSLLQIQFMVRRRRRRREEGKGLQVY
jgi:hypothetical protein